MGESVVLGMDWGAGNVKVCGQDGAGVVLASQVAVAAEGVSAGEALGLRCAVPPLAVRLNGHRFFVGLGAHDWGRPVENLDDGRFVAGSPELRALTYGAMAYFGLQFVLPTIEPVGLWVGLPQSALSRECAAGVRGWLRGEHAWWCAWDGGEEAVGAVTVDEVTVTSQAAAALFDFLLDDEGQFIPERKGLFKQEIGIVSVGMNTVELLVVEGGKPKERFTASLTAGVRRLLELVDPRGLYSRGELDTRLRAGSLDVGEAVPVWAAEVVGLMENRWGRAAGRFAATVVVGGGALLLGPSLVAALAGKAWVADDPVLAVARGLVKMARQKASRRRA